MNEYMICIVTMTVVFIPHLEFCTVAWLEDNLKTNQCAYLPSIPTTTLEQ